MSYQSLVPSTFTGVVSRSLKSAIGSNSAFLAICIGLCALSLPCVAAAEPPAPSSIEQLDRLSLQAVKKEIELEKFNLRYELEITRTPRWKGWRYFAFQESNAVVLESGLIAAMVDRDHQIRHKGVISGALLEEALIPQMTGQFIGALGDVDELAINAWHAWTSRRAGFDATTARRYSIAIHEDIKRLLKQRAELLAGASGLTESEKTVYSAEGEVLEDLAEVGWLQSSRFQRHATRIAFTQNSFYCLDIVKNVTGAIGNIVGIESNSWRRPRMNVPANILTTVSGAFIVANPLLSRAVGKAASIWQQHNGLGTTDRETAQQAVNRLNRNLEMLRGMAVKGKEGQTVPLPVARMALLEENIARFGAEIYKERLANQKAFTAALGRVAIAGIVGQTKIATGVCGIVAADRFPLEPRKGAPILLGGNIAYSIGTDIAIVDNLKLEVIREIHYQKNKKAGKLPEQLLSVQIANLEKVEKTIDQLK